MARVLLDTECNWSKDITGYSAIKAKVHTSELGQNSVFAKVALVHLKTIK